MVVLVVDHQFVFVHVFYFEFSRLWVLVVLLAGGWSSLGFLALILGASRLIVIGFVDFAFLFVNIGL